MGDVLVSIATGQLCAVLPEGAPLGYRERMPHFCVLRVQDVSTLPVGANGAARFVDLASLPANVRQELGRADVAELPELPALSETPLDPAEALILPSRAREFEALDDLNAARQLQASLRRYVDDPSKRKDPSVAQARAAERAQEMAAADAAVGAADAAWKSERGAVPAAANGKRAG